MFPKFCYFYPDLILFNHIKNFLSIPFLIMIYLYKRNIGIFLSVFLALTFCSNLYSQVGIGNTDPKSSLDVSGALSLREGPALVLLNNNNENINLGTTVFSTYRITGPTNNFNILSFNTPEGVAANDGQILTLINTTTHKMTLVHNDGSPSNLQRRIFCPNGKNLVVEGQNASVTLIYNSSVQRWVVMSHTDTGGYGKNIQSKVGITDIETDVSTAVDMEDMVITFTPKNPKVYVNFSASGTMDKGAGGSAQGFANFELRKDATTVAGITTLASDRSFIDMDTGPCGNESCEEMFYDNGGPNGNYNNHNFTDITTFTPPVGSGQKTSVYFISFNTEARYDGLMVYDGPNDQSPLIPSSYIHTSGNSTTCPTGAWNGPGTSGTSEYSAEGVTFTSTHPTGALHFVFKTDISILGPGWEACVNYISPTPCREMFYDLGGASAPYPANTTQTQLYTPTNPGERISVHFTDFQTNYSDGLMIYDGPDNTYPIISSGSPANGSRAPAGSWRGDDNGPYSAKGQTFTASSNGGELYFVFKGGITTRRGWEACVSSIEAPSDFSLDTAWNAGLTMYPVNVTPGVETTIKVRWSRNGNNNLPYILRNNVNSEADRSHRSLTIFD